MLNLVTWPRSSWSIFDELESLQEDMNRALTGRASGAESSRRSTYGTKYPLMNVWSSEEGVVIDAELPGVDPKDVDISVKGDEVTLCGKAGGEGKAEVTTYHRRERPAGEFKRTLQLPFKADAAGVKANYRNGLLRVIVPRSEDEKPRKIAVEAA